MATQQVSEMTQMNFRLSVEAKSLIERAATLAGLTITDFAISSLMERAQEVFDRHTHRVMSDRDRDLFLALIDRDAEPNEALRKASEFHQQLIVE